MNKSVQRLTWLKESLVRARDADLKLDMGSWVSLDREPDIDYIIIENKELKGFDEVTACGTVCCNAGWAGLHPKLMELGLETIVTPCRIRYGPYEGQFGADEELTLNGGGFTLYSFIQDPDEGDDEEPSLADLFGVSNQHARALFDDYGDYTNSVREEIVPGITDECDEHEGGYMTFDKSIQLVDALIPHYEKSGDGFIVDFD